MARGPMTRKWQAGYVRQGVFIILKRVGGRLYEKSTRATTEAGALEQLRRFEKDPERYTPSPDAPAPILLVEKDDEDQLVASRLVTEFLLWSRDEKGNTPEWVDKQQRALAWWADHLRGDLRPYEPPEGAITMLREQILPPLHRRGRKVGAWKHKAAVLKAFYGWLCAHKHLLTPAEDPCRGMLQVPAAKPAQWDESKVIPPENLAKAWPLLPQYERDAVTILSELGFHVSEAYRFAQKGEVKPLRPGYAGYGDALLSCPVTKSGAPLTLDVSVAVAEAGRRLRAEGTRGMTMIGWHNALARALAVACAQAKVPTIRPGNFRHTLLTTGIEQGAAPGALSAFVNHRSVRTTLRYYATLAVRPNPMLKAATPAPVPPSPPTTPTTPPSSNRVGTRRRLAVVK